MAIITSLKPGVSVRLRMRLFPRPPYVLDVWTSNSASVLSMDLLVLFFFYIINIAMDVTTDKESRMRVCTAKVDSPRYKQFP